MKCFSCLAVLCALVVSGCGAVSKTSGVIPLSSNMYTVGAKGSFGSVTESRKLAHSEAEGFCASKGLNVLVVEIKMPSDVNFDNTYDVTFMCLEAGDSRLTTFTPPKITNKPDVGVKIESE